MDFSIYKDIKNRTNGEIYIGVVGPVRTGKSTFIKNFMNLAIIPNIKDENDIKRAQDELPQSAAGKTIMTTEPKFIPNKAVNINLKNDINASVFFIELPDCFSGTFQCLTILCKRFLLNLFWNVV